MTAKCASARRIGLRWNGTKRTRTHGDRPGGSPPSYVLEGGEEEEEVCVLRHTVRSSGAGAALWRRRSRPWSLRSSLAAWRRTGLGWRAPTRPWSANRCAKLPQLVPALTPRSAQIIVYRTSRTVRERQSEQAASPQELTTLGADEQAYHQRPLPSRRGVPARPPKAASLIRCAAWLREATPNRHRPVRLLEPES